jgi:hypothetical protein
VLEGTVVAVSRLPDPKTADYVHCDFVVEIAVSTICSGASVPRRILVVLPGFRNRQFTPQAKYRAEDLVRVSVVPFDQLPDEEKWIQRVDLIDAFDLEVFAWRASERIEALGGGGSSVSFRPTGAASAAPAVNPAPSVASQALLREAMAKDLQRIRQLSRAHGGTFSSWWKELGTFRDEYPGGHVGAWHGDSYFATRGEHATTPLRLGNAVQALVSLDRFFKARNIDFILLYIPRRSDLTGDLFTEAMPADLVQDPAALIFIKELLEQEVEVVDATPLALQRRFEFPLMFWYQLPESSTRTSGRAPRSFL